MPYTRRPPFSKIFSKTVWPIKAKLHVEPPREGGTIVYINGPGHMTVMATLPIYGENLQKSSPDPKILKLNMQYQWLNMYKVYVIDDSGWTLIIIEPRCEKTGILHMRKQRRRSASRYPRS